MAAGLQARARPALETDEEQRKAYRQFDIVLVILISMPAAVQYIFWEKFRLPLAATLLTLCLVAAEWLNRVVNMHGWAYFPLDFIWPSTLIPSGIALDVVL